MKSVNFTFKKPDGERRRKDKYHQGKTESREDNWVCLICFYMFENKAFILHIHQKPTPCIRFDDMKQWDKFEKK